MKGRSEHAQAEIQRLMRAPATLETARERLAHLEELAPLVFPGHTRSLTSVVAAVALAEARLAAHGVGKAPEAMAFVADTTDDYRAAVQAIPFSSVAALVHRAVDAARAEAADLIAPPVPTSPARTLDVVNGRWVLRVDGVERGLKRRRSEPGTRDTDLRAARGGRITDQSKWLIALALRSQGKVVNLPRYQDWSRLVAALREVDVQVDEGSDEPRLVTRLELGEEAFELAMRARVIASAP